MQDRARMLCLRSAGTATGSPYSVEPVCSVGIPLSSGFFTAFAGLNKTHILLLGSSRFTEDIFKVVWLSSGLFEPRLQVVCSGRL